MILSNQPQADFALIDCILSLPGTRAIKAGGTQAGHTIRGQFGKAYCRPSGCRGTTKEKQGRNAFPVGCLIQARCHQHQAFLSGAHGDVKEKFLLFHSQSLEREPRWTADLLPLLIQQKGILTRPRGKPSFFEAGNDHERKSQAARAGDRKKVNTALLKSAFRTGKIRERLRQRSGDAPARHGNLRTFGTKSAQRGKRIEHDRESAPILGSAEERLEPLLQQLRPSLPRMSLRPSRGCSPESGPCIAKRIRGFRLPARLLDREPAAGSFVLLFIGCGLGFRAAQRRAFLSSHCLHSGIPGIVAGEETGVVRQRAPLRNVPKRRGSFRQSGSDQFHGSQNGAPGKRLRFQGGNRADRTRQRAPHESTAALQKIRDAPQTKRFCQYRRLFLGPPQHDRGLIKTGDHALASGPQHFPDHFDRHAGFAGD